MRIHAKKQCNKCGKPKHIDEFFNPRTPRHETRRCLKCRITSANHKPNEQQPDLTIEQYLAQLNPVSYALTRPFTALQGIAR